MGLCTEKGNIKESAHTSHPLTREKWSTEISGTGKNITTTMMDKRQISVSKAHFDLRFSRATNLERKKHTDKSVKSNRKY